MRRPRQLGSSPGCTRALCPGCQGSRQGKQHDPYSGGDVYTQRPTHGICQGCQRLIDKGLNAEANEQILRDTAATTLCRIPTRGYASNFDAHMPFGKDSHIGEALMAFIHTISQKSTEYADHTHPAPIPFSSGQTNWSEGRRMKTSTLKAFTRLVTVVNRAFRATYIAGKRDGRNILTGLASGEVSINELTELTLNESRYIRGRD